MPEQRNDSEEYVMVVSASDLWNIGYFEGISFDLEKYLTIINDKNKIVFNRRQEMEKNPGYKQIIPYVILNHDGTIFSYRRGKLQGEKRLLGNYSIGVGGHISTKDMNLFDIPYQEAMRRELNEELKIESPFKEYIAALLNDDSNEVGRVHLGIIHILCLDKPLVTRREQSIIEATFVDHSQLLKEIQKYENWSQLCIQKLERLLESCR